MAGIPKLSSIPDPDPVPDSDASTGDRTTADEPAPSVEPLAEPTSEAVPTADETAEVDHVAAPESADDGAPADKPTVELPAAPQLLAEPHTVEQQAAPTATPAPPTRRRRRRAFGLLVVLVIAGAAAAGAYAAWPTLKERYVTPVQTNADDIDAVDARVDDVESRLVDLSGADDRLASAIDDTADRIDDIDELLAEQNGRIDDLDTVSATLGEDLATSRSDAAAMVQVLRATELLGRARLFMYQANYGLASEDMQAARDILTELPADGLPAGDAIERLDRAIAAVRVFPVVAADDLDIAWQLLLAGNAGS